MCLERGADLHTAQLMPLPLTVSCFSKIQIGFTFLVLAHLGSPGKGPLNGCVCVLPTKWRRKPAGIDVKRNYVTVNLCVNTAVVVVVVVVVSPSPRERPEVVVARRRRRRRRRRARWSSARAATASWALRGGGRGARCGRARGSRATSRRTCRRAAARAVGRGTRRCRTGDTRPDERRRTDHRRAGRPGTTSR